MTPPDAIAKAADSQALLLRTVDQVYSVVDGADTWPQFQQTVLELLALLDADADADVPREDVTAMVTLLTRHLNRAVRQQHAKFEQQKLIEFQDGLLEQHHLAIGLCHGDGTLRWANLRMREYLLAVPAAQLRDLCAPATARPLSLHLQLPVGRITILAVDAAEAGPGCVTLMASPPGARSLDLSSLRTLFGLTDTEARIAQRMVQGESAEQIASAHGTSVHTVRTQIKQLLGKVGVNRQSELVAALVTSPASVAVGGEPAVSVPPPLWLQRGARRLAYGDYGPRDGKPVLFMHSWAGSRLQLPPDPHSLFGNHIRLIIPERPGVARSDPQPLDDDSPSAMIGPWTEDVAALADHLGLQQFDVMGYSLGALFALATAGALGKRVSRVTLLSPISPLRSTADLQDMMPSARAMLGLALRLPQLVPITMTLWLAWLRRRPSLYFESVRAHLAPADAQVMDTPYMRAHYERVFAEAIEGGNARQVQELLLMASDWSELLTVRQPVTIWHGDSDSHVPLSHAQRMQAALPDAKLIVIPDAGHYLAYRHWPGILSSLT